MELLLGDNPFFGIDNLSQERARKKIKKSNELENIVEIMDFVENLGVKGFVVSTHPQLKHLIKNLKTESNLLEKFEFYPILPYAQSYVSKAAENGIVGGINEILSSGSISSKLNIAMQGSIGLIKKDVRKLLETFIDIELLPLREVKKNTIFLHDGLTDLALGLGMKDVIETFVNRIKDHYHVKPGLVTKNFPMLLRFLENCDIDIPTIMTSFNPIGYQMNPSKMECEKQISKTEVIAMNTLAAGYITPLESFEYLSKLGLSSVVVGMSTKEHAQETISIFKEKTKNPMTFRNFTDIVIKSKLGVSPSGDDTKFVAEHANKLNFKSALDIGTGTGVIAIYLVKNGHNCDGTDVNPLAVECAIMNAKRNNCKINFFVSNLFDNVKKKYDLIIFNAPLGSYSSPFMNKYLEIIKSIFPRHKFESKMVHKTVFKLTKNQRKNLITRFFDSVKQFQTSNGKILLSIHTPELYLVEDMTYETLAEYHDIWRLILIKN